MERAIALNIYQQRQARYRGLEIVPGKPRDSILVISFNYTDIKQYLQTIWKVQKRTNAL